MKMSDKKILVVTTIVCLMPCLMAVLIYNKLPAEIPIHWNGMGEIDNYAPKAVASFGLPMLFVVLNLISQIGRMREANKQVVPKPLQLIFVWLIPMLAITMIPMSFLISMNVEISIIHFVYLLLGLLFIILGNYMPKIRQNKRVGIKLKWTLNSVENWNKTHRLSGYLWLASGIVILLKVIFLDKADVSDFYFIWVIILLSVIVPTFYSYYLYKMEAKNRV